MNASDIIRRADTARADKDLWKSIFEQAYEYAMPMRNPYTGNNKNPRPMDKMYDSTAMSSTFRGVNRMVMEITPPEGGWFDLKAGPLLEMQVDKSEIEAIEKSLAKTVKLLGMVFRSGSFVSAIHEAFLDLFVTGMGVILAVENTGNDIEPIIYEAVSQAEVTIEEGIGGSIAGVYRTRKVKVRQIQNFWSDAVIPDELSEIIAKAKKGNDPEIEILEATFEGDANTPWHYKVFWKKGGNDPVELVDRSYTTNPFIVFRWSKIAGSAYGPGPVIMALPDIKTANKVMQMNLINAALALAGIYLVEDDGVINPDNITLTQGAMIPVARTGGNLGASIEPLSTGRNFDIGQIVLEDLRVQIKKQLFDSALPPIEGSVRSATEIIQRMKELAEEIGGAYGRLMHELVVPLVRRTADILQNRGFIPQLQIDQYILKVQVNSPLARVQQMQEVEKVIQWLEITMSLAGQEGMMMSSKIEEIIPWIADKIGVPAELGRDDAEREELQQMIAQLIAQSQMQQQS